MFICLFTLSRYTEKIYRCIDKHVNSYNDIEMYSYRDMEKYYTDLKIWRCIIQIQIDGYTEIQSYPDM